MEPAFGLCVLMFLAAALYASVGHGGASAYITLLTLFNYSAAVVKPVALELNLVVSLLSFYHFYKAGYFQWRLFYPFALTSVPASFAGGMMNLNNSSFKVVLGILLVFPVLNFMGFFNRSDEGEIRKISLPLALTAGGLIGFISGLIGIGGGILLSPFMLIMKWSGVKEAAAVAALYIFVNSLAGLYGQSVIGIIPNHNFLILLPFIITGGLLGGYSGAMRLNTIVIKKLLALVLLIASIKLVFI